MFDNIPLHPAIVHLPLGVAFFLPLVTVLAAFLLSRKLIGRAALLLVVFLHVFLVGSSYVALETGENEEHTVGKLVGESIVEDHEEKAEAFMVTTIVVFGLSLVWFVFGTGSLARPTLILVLVGHVALLIFGFRVGHSGGELVYIHGAAEAYVDVKKPPQK